MYFTKPPIYQTEYGSAYVGDCLDYFKHIPDNSLDLIITSPPYPLVKKKGFGNVSCHEYVDWFLPFASEFYRTLKPTGSFVLNVGGTWLPKMPFRCTYHFELCLELTRRLNFKLAQEFVWFSPTRIPDVQYANVLRIRVRSSFEMVWWFAKDNPYANNRAVLVPYSDSFYKKQKKYEGSNRVVKHPSGYIIELGKIYKDNGGSIPNNVLVISHSNMNQAYAKKCRSVGKEPHPARFPIQLPEFFIKFLTNPGDLVVDPFAGSNTTGEAAEKLQRRWIAFELNYDYLSLSRFRFPLFN